MELSLLPSDKQIVQSNVITSGRYDFTACQLDILFMILGQLGAKDTVDTKYDINVKDIESITSRVWNYQQLQQATEEMGSRMFVIDTEESRTQLWLFSSFQYHTGKGYFTAALSAQARPYLFDLKDNYTHFELRAALACKSKYAKRLYVLACQWRRAGKVTMPISELKEMLFLKDPRGKEKEQYTEITALRKFVLDVAKDQINKHTDIQFDYKLSKKHSRAYTHITLFANFTPVSTIQTSIDFKEDPDTLIKIRSITSIGISEEMARTIISTRYYQEFIDLKQEMHDRARNKGAIIEDPAAYIIGAFQKKGFLLKNTKGK